MNLKQKNKKLYFLLVFTVILLVITSCFWFAYFFLRVNKPIVSSNLIIEGWIPGCAVESKQVKNIISQHNNVYFSGIAASFQEDIFNSPMQYGRSDKGLVSNGALYLSSLALQALPTDTTYTRIELYAHGFSANNVFAHFFVSIADTVLFQQFSTEKTNLYIIDGHFSKANLKFLNIYYGNDMYFNYQDRNLFIDSLKIGSFVLRNKEQFVFVSDNALDQCRRNYPFQSNGAYLQAYLKSLGYLSEGKVVDTMYCGRNQTLYMAKHITQQLENKDATYNILSYFLHSRRTKITYSRFIYANNLGIYALEDISKPFENKHQTIDTLRFVIDEWISIFVSYFYMV